MEENKRRRGDRRDATLVRDADPMHAFTPYLMPNRADNEAFVSETIDLTNINRFLEEKNKNNPKYKYTIFHVFAAAIAKTITLRPYLNRFICGHRLYQRNDIIMSFVAKKVFSDDGGELLIFLECGKGSTIDKIHDHICDKVSAERSKTSGADHTTNMMEMLTKIPRPILRLVMRILNWLNYHGWVPQWLGKEDPDMASVFISNLGSIKLHAGYHHLANWGTNSIFIVIGEKHPEPQFDENGFKGLSEVLELGITLDERIADGYYFSKSIRLLRHLLQNPELLDRPANEEVDYE
ncbi:MAG: hypothetical protein J5662_08785 [Clostridia bacterium]|nr:hypothetical protein [Clostridia bacterium]